MRHRAAALVTVLALLAGFSAHADTEVFGNVYWVTGTGGSSTHTGADSLTHAYTLSQACAIAVAGDTIKFNHSSFRGQKIAPSRSGTSQAAIVFMGDSLYPSTISVGALDFGQYSTGDTCIRVIGLRVLNSVTQTYCCTPAGLINTNYIHVESCVFDSVGFLQSHVYGKGGERSALVNCRISSDVLQMESGETSALFTGSNCGYLSGWENPNTLDYDTLMTSTIVLYNPSSGSTTVKLTGMDHMYMARNRFTITGGPNAAHGLWKMYGVQYSQFLDNWISMRNLNTDEACDECGTMYFRETTQFNNWQRDTILSMGTGLGTAWRQNELSASGSCVGRTSNNTYNQCVFRDSATAHGQGSVTWQNGSRGDTFTNNLVVSQIDYAVSMEASYNSEYPTLIANNTFICLGSGTNVSESDFNATATFYNNIYYATGAPHYVSQFTSPNGILATTDHNLYWSTGAAADSCVLWGSTKSDVGPSGTPYTANEQEYHSTFEDPLFVNVTTNAFTFDAHLKTESPARYANSGIGYGGLDRGCYQYGGTVQPPQDAVFWVAPEARGGSYTAAGTDSTAPMTLKRANENAEAGQTYVLLGGDYTADTRQLTTLCGAACTTAGLTAEIGAGVCPLKDGTAADSAKAIRFMSHWYYRAAVQGVATAADTNSYRLASITLAHSFAQVSGLTADTVAFRAQTANGSACATNANPTSWCYRPVSDSLTYCKGKVLNMQAASACAIRNCWFITPLTAGATGPVVARNYLLGGVAKLRGEEPGCINVAINDSYFRVRVNYNQHGLSIGGFSQNITFNRCQFVGDMIPSSVVVSASVPDTSAFLALRNSHHVAFNDCRFKVNSGAAETSPGYSTDSLDVCAIVFQNGFNNGTFLRDTLDLGFRAPLGAATAGAVIQILSAGGFAAGTGGANQAIQNILWSGCLVRGDYMFRQLVKTANVSHRQSVFGSKRYSPVSYALTSCDSLSFDQCTFYADSIAGGTARYRSQPAIQVMTANTKLVSMTRNIFYRAKVNRDADMGQTPSGAVVQLGGIGNRIYTDRNLYYAVAGGDDSTRTGLFQTAAMFVNGWASAGAIRDSVGLNNTPQVPYLSPVVGQEASSWWGSPAFADVGVDSTFTGALSCRVASWAAYRPATPDSAVGGVQDDTPRPGVCTTLHTTAYTPTTITVSFIAAANDSVLGRGVPSAYEIVFGTSPGIIDGSYATHVVNGTSPGSTVSVALGSGADVPLNNATIYFYAVYTRSRCGARSPLSAISCGKTQTGAATGGGDETVCQ